MATEASTSMPAATGALGRFEELIARLGEIEDPAARETAEEMVGAVVELYGEGLRRISSALGEAGESEGSAERVRRGLAEDGVVASLLLIHDLYPVELEVRVREALDQVRPYMESHGGDVELIGITDGVARIRLEGSCNGCAASSATLELAIKQALTDAAPDLEGLEVEGAVEAPAMPEPSGLELPVIQLDGPGAAAADGNGAAGAGSGSWHDLPADLVPSDGGPKAVEVAGRRLVVTTVGGDLLAYVDSCAGCEGPLADGELAQGMLACPGCGRRYELARAGRVLGDEVLQLEPVPLLGDASEGYRVAVRG